MWRCGIERRGPLGLWFLVLIAAGALSCDSPLDANLTEADRLMVTDATSYEWTARSNGLETTIRYTYSNRTGERVELRNCNGDVRPTLERWVENEWVAVWGPLINSCLSPAKVIEPGMQYRDQVTVFAGTSPTGTPPQFGAHPLAGTYRLVWLHAYRDYRPDGPPWGTEIPKDERVSNRFELTSP